MSSRLVIPVQLMSRVWGGREQLHHGSPQHKLPLLAHHSPLQGSQASAPPTHRAADEEEAERPHERRFPQQWLQDNAQGPMQLQAVA